MDCAEQNKEKDERCQWKISMEKMKENISMANWSGNPGIRKDNQKFHWRRVQTVIGPQPLEKLGVLPQKLRGGLGQPPETWNQLPQGPAARFQS